MAGGQSRGQPRFLGIGAQHAGTSWLAHNLRTHPEVWMPPVKELHYWDALRPGADAYDPPLHPNLARFIRIRNRTTLRLYAYATLQFRSSPWQLMRYWLGRRSDEWYARFFPRHRFAGEITPAYMSVPRPVVEAVHRLNPDMKLVLLLRNPIDRTWSSARWYLKHDAALDPVKLLDDPKIMEQAVIRSDYATAVRNWREVFGAERLFVGFYDDLCERPRELFKSILQFLGVSADDRFIPAGIDKAVNAAPRRDMPPAVAARLAAMYWAPLRELEALVGGRVTAWRAAAEELALQPQA